MQAMIGTAGRWIAAMRAGIVAPLLLLAAVYVVPSHSMPAPAAGTDSGSLAAERSDAALARLPAEPAAVGQTGSYPTILASASGISGAALPASVEALPDPARAAAGIRLVPPATAARLLLAYRPQAPPS
jgi:hypothetical protein